jgi:fatty acid desaturase
MKGLLTKEEITEFSRIRHGRLISELTLWWVLLIALVQLSVFVGISWALLGCILLIGCLQNGMILWTHEASHYCFHRDKERNDFWGDLVVCGAIGISVEGYRWHHSLHHKHLGDPTKEVELSAYACLRGAQLLVQMGRHLGGLVAYNVIFRRQQHLGDTPFEPPPPRSKAAWAGFLIGNGALFALCALQNAWYIYFIAWAVPLVTLAVMISNFRTIVEHQPSSDVCDSGASVVPAIARIVDANIVEQMLIAPVGFHYHHEHHLYPGIPYCNLPKVRRLLKSRGYYETADLVRSKGYIRSIWKLATVKGFGRTFLAAGDAVDERGL